MDEPDFHDSDFRLKAYNHPFRFWSISEGGSVLSSPFISDGMMFFGCNDGHIYCLDPDGNVEWYYKTNDRIFSSPTCYGDYVLIGSCDGFLYAFSKNGELLWKFQTNEKATCTPLIVGGTVYFGSNNGIFYALSVEDGKELWRYNHAAGIFFMSPSAADNSVISGHINGDVFCLSKDGELLWKVCTGGHTLQTPLVIDEHNNELSSFALRSFESFPKSKDYRVLIGSADHYLRCIDSSGKVVWKFDCNLMGSSSPAISENTVYLGSFDGNMYAVKANGRLKWTFFTGNRIVSSPVCREGSVYFGSSDHNLYALDKSGRMEWRFLADGEIVSSPVIYKDNVYFGSWDGNMYAVSLKTRELLWKFKTMHIAPSYIRKPTAAASTSEKSVKIEEPATTKGADVKGNYSSVTGELTNMFYGSSIPYKTKKTSYQPDDKYRSH